MTIYINPFVAGILATIIAEFLLALLYGVYLNWRDKKK